MDRVLEIVAQEVARGRLKAFKTFDYSTAPDGAYDLVVSSHRRGLATQADAPEAMAAAQACQEFIRKLDPHPPELFIYQFWRTFFVELGERAPLCLQVLRQIMDDDFGPVPDIMAKKLKGLEPPESSASREPLDLAEEPDGPPG